MLRHTQDMFDTDEGDLAKPETPLTMRLATSREKAARALPFDPVDSFAGVYFGRLGEVWQRVCVEHNFGTEYSDTSGAPTPTRAPRELPLGMTQPNPIDNRQAPLKIKISW